MLLRGGAVLVQEGATTDFRQLDVRVESEVITEVGRGFETSADEDVLDCTQKWVIPGLIDAHVHTAGLYGAIDPFLMKDISIAEATLLAARSARMLLHSGFTTIRDVGGRDYIDVALRNAIAAGMVSGPSMYVSGRPLCMTGGHAAPLLRSRQVDGIDEARKGAREQLAMTVNQIKVMATGGGMSATGTPGRPQLSVAEMKAIVEEAARAGITVAAHAHGLEGIANAIQAGVHSVEHGTYADEATLTEMARRGVYLVMCIGATAFMAGAEAASAGVPEFMQRNCRELLEQQKRTFRLACDIGVPIAFGSDCGTPLNPAGGTGREFEFLVENGMDEGQAIAAATTSAAMLLGIEGKTGSIAPGKAADILVLEHDPLRDISVLARPEEEILCILRKGNVVRRE